MSMLNEELQVKLELDNEKTQAVLQRNISIRAKEFGYTRHRRFIGTNFI